MGNIEYHNPTHLILGAGVLSRLGETVSKHGKKALLVTGGGSTMDAAKVMAAGAPYESDPWDTIGHGQANWLIPTRALPIITVPTLAATGSEMNSGAVISNEETKVKSFVQADCLYPKVVLVDPELTLAVPKIRPPAAYAILSHT